MGSETVSVGRSGVGGYFLRLEEESYTAKPRPLLEVLTLASSNVNNPVT